METQIDLRPYTQQIERLRRAAITVVASSHELQDGQHDTPNGLVLVEKAALLKLNAALAETR